MQTHSESLAIGASGTWSEWECINKLHTKMGHSKHNIKVEKKIIMIPRASAKKADKTMDHLLEFPLLQQTCSLSDLIVYNDTERTASNNGSV